MFNDRFDAARQLIPYLEAYRDNPTAIILAIPRGGLELGSVLARGLHLPLDVILSKKIGFPGNPEYAIGAVSLENVTISPQFADVPELEDYITEQIVEIRKLLNERNAQYRGNKPPLNLTDKIVIVVDDGVATGNTLRATLALIRQHRPAKIVVALPVAPATTLAELRKEADEVVCVLVPQVFLSVGQFYRHFYQVSDDEAIRLLQESNT